MYFPFKGVWKLSLILMASAKTFNVHSNYYNHTPCTVLDTTNYEAKQGYSSWYLFVQTVVLNIIMLNFFV